MARIIQSKFPIDLQKSRAIGFGFPLNGDAVFVPTYFTRDQIKANMVNYLLTNKGERYKVKYKKVYSDKFEIYKGNLHRVFKKIEIKKPSDSNEIKLNIMNHPFFIMNNNFDFYQERDDNGKLWLCFYFNVMNYNDAIIIQEYIDNL